MAAPAWDQSAPAWDEWPWDQSAPAWDQWPWDDQPDKEAEPVLAEVPVAKQGNGCVKAEVPVARKKQYPSAEEMVAMTTERKKKEQAAKAKDLEDLRARTQERELKRQAAKAKTAEEQQAKKAKLKDGTGANFVF